MKRLAVALVVLGAVTAWAVWSYANGGFIHLLFASDTSASGGLEALRQYVLSWGALAPLVYVAAVTIEVLVAPIPGTLLYAPAGAIFGGLVGGTLSLVGNVLGAAIACWLGRALGERWVARRVARGGISRYRQRLVTRSVWIVFLLRVNPFTSSDLVSYAAGAMSVPVRHVAMGTLFGMAPLCYAQAYLAASLLEILPGGPIVLLACGGVYVMLVVALVLKR